ncbi:MAG: PfkB family carbohydrate kinase [Leadbetterella sp.]
MRLLTVGSVAFDKIETPTQSTEKIVGGAATYIALSASYFLEKNNSILGVVGEDFPDEMIQILINRKIDTSNLEKIQGGKTFFWHGKYHTDMNHRDTLDTQLGVFENWIPNVPESHQNTEFLMLGNNVPSIQHQTLKQFKIKPKFVLLDTMNLWMDIMMDDLKTLISEVDCVTINDGEARQLSGEYALHKAAAKILTMGPKTLIIKKGEHGALLFQGDQVFFCPALLLDSIIDPTGAGDTFAGGFIGYLSKTNDLSFDNMKMALLYGSAMASFCVQKFGTEAIQNLQLEDIEKRVATLKKMIEI